MAASSSSSARVVTPGTMVAMGWFNSHLSAGRAGNSPVAMGFMIVTPMLFAWHSGMSSSSGSRSTMFIGMRMISKSKRSNARNRARLV